MPTSGFNTNGAGTVNKFGLPKAQGFIPIAQQAISAFNAKTKKTKPTKEVTQTTAPTQEIKNTNSNTGLIGNSNNTQNIVTQSQQTPRITPGILPTSQTPATYAQQVTESSQPSAKADYYSNAAVQGMQAQNVGRLAPYAESKFYGQGGQSQGALPSLSLPDLAGRGAPDQQLFNTLGNIYGSAAQTGLSNALAQQQLQQSGANINLQASLPQLGQPGQVPFSPLTQQQGSILGTQGGGSGLLVAGNIAQLPRLQEAYTTMSNNIGAIQGIEGLLSNTLGGTQNISDVNVINQAINKIKQNTSSAEYNQFKTLLSSLGQLYSGYFSGSGQETDATRQIGQSLIDGTASASTIKAVLDTLKSEAGIRLSQLHSNIQNITNNPSYLPSPSTGGNQPSTSGSTGGGTYDF